MGWTTTSDYERYHKGLFTIREYLDREFASDHPDFRRLEVLDSSMTGRTEYYAAIRSTNRETGKVIVFALIAMVRYSAKAHDGHTLGWKDMSERSLPYLFNCPEQILKHLDPTDDPNALEWRQTCREKRSKAQVTRKALAHGTVIVFKEPLTFTNGTEHARFTVVREGRKTLFRAETGMLCRIPKIAERAFEVVELEPVS